MGNEMFQARLDDDFAQEIHNYREEQHMNKSEAVRSLFRAGLNAETADEPSEAERAVQKAIVREAVEEALQDRESDESEAGVVRGRANQPGTLLHILTFGTGIIAGLIAAGGI